MKRFVPLASTAGSSTEGRTADDAAQIDWAICRGQVSGGFAQSWFLPMHYEKNYAYPLLVWLHGPGQDESQLQRVMPLISLRNYTAVAPRGTHSCSVTGSGFRWDMSEAALLEAERRMLECVDQASRRFHIAGHRVFLAGFRCGGTMALHLGLRNPGLVAGALSIHGPFPTRHAPLSRLTQARGIPLFISSGRRSHSYPVDQACREMRLFHAAGLSVSLRQYSGGDPLHPQVLSDVNHWIMDRISGQTADGGEAAEPTFD